MADRVSNPSDPSPARSIPQDVAGEGKPTSDRAPHWQLNRQLKVIGLLVAVLAILFLVYLPTLLTIVNGSPDPYAEDVAEIQTALNLWGTIHATGYPLYAITGAAFVAVMRGLGMNPATAPCLYSMLWGFIALSIFYGLIVKLTHRVGVAGVATLLLGLTRGEWAYSVVAKPYTMTLAFCALLLAIAFWPGLDARRRVLLLALVGGFAIAHHRMIGFMGLGLLIAALPPLLRERWRRALPTLIVALPIALIGFLPYLYLPARAYANGVWVYGDPRTPQGFWNEFTAVEANHLFRFPATGEQWFADARDTVDILVSQMSPVGVFLGLVIVLINLTPRPPLRLHFWRVQWPRQRGGVRNIHIALLCSLGFVIFVLVLHRVVMPTAVVMPVVMLLVFVSALTVSDLLDRWSRFQVGVPIVAVIGSAALIALSFSYIYGITHDDSGLKMIALAKQVPRDGVFMLPWSTSYNDVAFSKYVTGENADLPLVDHKADFKSLAIDGRAIYTYKDTFYRFPLSWWDAFGTAYLSGEPNGVIGIHNAALHMPANQSPNATVTGGIVIDDYLLTCRAAELQLRVDWNTSHKPERDLSVFVHLIGKDESDVLATGDQNAPVYGWYPTRRWSENETVIDSYTLPYREGATAIQFGMYEQTAAGQFVNYGTTIIPLKDGQGCSKS